MRIYKGSYYNFFIPVEEKNIILLYNTLQGGLYELSFDMGREIENIISQKIFSIDEYRDVKEELNKLIDAGCIIESDIDEMETYKKIYTKMHEKLSSKFSITITPTLDCNLACRYCFQNESKERFMTMETMDQISSFISKRLPHNEEKEKAPFNLTWFGGEPLLASEKLYTYSRQLIEICEEKRYDYNASIITNGTLLTSNVWDTLQKCKVESLQVTLDGPACTHNIRRPYKNGTEQSYDVILHNLKNMPKEIHVAIRINTDKCVWDNIDILLDDLENEGIWPQKAKQMNLSLAFITSHENARFQDRNWLWTYKEFLKIENIFIDKKLEHYNQWATKNNIKLAKKKFKIPTLSVSECASAVSPHGYVIDAEGFVHKCWEDVDKPDTRVFHVSNPIEKDNGILDKWLSYSRLNNQTCMKCKVLPVCESHCTKKKIEDKQNEHCTPWKYMLKSYIKEQYIEKECTPELYVM